LSIFSYLLLLHLSVFSRLVPQPPRRRPFPYTTLFRSKIARDVFAAMWEGEHNGDPDAIIEARGLKQISDTGAIGAMIDEVLAANPAIVEQYRAGRDKAFNSLVGQVMKAARGKANPQQVNQLLKEKLDG